MEVSHQTANRVCFIKRTWNYSRAQPISVYYFSHTQTLRDHSVPKPIAFQNKYITWDYSVEQPITTIRVISV